MDSLRYRVSFAVLAACVSAMLGCATERAIVSISYVVEPSKGLPPGMNSVAIMDSRVNTVTDRKWSELAANSIQARIQDANDKYGANLRIADRKHLAEGLAEQDLAAAGITSGYSAGGKVMEVRGIIESEINVKVATKRGTQSTISGFGGFGGGRSGGGHIDTREVETVQRSITVQTTFKLVDTVNNRNWITYSPAPYSRSDRTHTSILFGSSQTEAELTPRDEIIGAAVERGIREFVGKIVPCKMEYELPVESSANANCVQGVRMLRAQAYAEALSYFRAAVAENPNDDKAAYAAGVAAEASGDYQAALDYYRRAYGLRASARYKRARDRLFGHIARIRGS